MFQDPGEFRRCQAKIQNHQDSANQHGSEVGLQRHDAVECEHRDAVSGAYAKGLQSGCQAMGALAEFAVRETAFAIDNGNPVAVDGGAAGEKIEWSERRNHGLFWLIVLLRGTFEGRKPISDRRIK